MAESIAAVSRQEFANYFAASTCGEFCISISEIAAPQKIRCELSRTIHWSGTELPEPQGLREHQLVAIADHRSAIAQPVKIRKNIGLRTGLPQPEGIHPNRSNRVIGAAARTKVQRIQRRIVITHFSSK